MCAVKARVLACLLALPCLAGPASAAEGQDGRSILEACSADSQAGMRECLAEKARESVQALKQAEAAAAAALSRWDEDAKFIALGKSKLQAANKAFVQYREAQCAFAASLGGGAIGTALDMRRLACVFELNTRRAEQLANATSALPAK